jgi:transposase InsO family protein
MTGLWLTKAELQQITGWPKRTIEWKAQHDELEWKLADAPGSNNVRERLYSSNLPAEFTQKLLDFCIRKESLKATPETTSLVPLNSFTTKSDTPKSDTSQTQRSLFSSPAALIPFTSPELAGLTADQREVARRRFDAVQAIVDWRANPQPFFVSDGRQVRSLNDLVRWLAGQNGVGESAIWKWEARYARGGETPLAKFKALADRARSDRGLSRVLKQYPKAAEYALIKYLGLAPSQYLEAARELRLPAETGLDHSMPRFASERLAITAVYEGIAREWPNWYNHGSRPPSYGTVLNFLKSLPDPVVTLARQGARAYENKCEPHLKRAYDMQPNEWWVSDHRIFDVFCWNDYFPEFQQEQGSWMRIWLTTMEDVRTRRVVGWAFSVNPSSRSVMAATRMAAQRFGMPKWMYMDNGEDYKLFAKVLKENFGIEHTSAKPFRPRSKPIESWHSTLSKRFDPMWGAAYAGHDAKQRSEDNTVALRLHREWREGKRISTPLPAASHFMKMFSAWIELEYNEWVHGGHGMHGLSPRALFDRELPNIIRKPLDVAQMEPLFWQRETRVVTNARVRINGMDYEPADAESDVALRLFNAREVRIACNPDDLAYALCYDTHGDAGNRDHTLVARLVAPKLIPWGKLSQDSLKAHERTNAQFRRGLKEFNRRMERKAGAVGMRSDLDELAARAGIVMPVPISPLQLGPAVTNPEASNPDVSHFETAAAEDRKSGAVALRAAVGGTPSGPRYIEDVVERARAAMKAGNGND